MNLHAKRLGNLAALDYLFTAWIEERLPVAGQDRLHALYRAAGEVHQLVMKPGVQRQIDAVRGRLHRADDELREGNFYSAHREERREYLAASAPNAS